MTPDLARIIGRLWKDSGVRTAYSRANEYHLSDCAQYFLENVRRLGEKTYVPTNQVRSYVATVDLLFNIIFVILLVIFKIYSRFKLIVS